MSEEMLVVVNGRDEVLEYLPRSICHRPPYLMHREIFVVLFEGLEKVWLQKRSMQKEQWPGRWTVTASGHVAKGQSYLDAAKRELVEEVGVEAVLKKSVKFVSELVENRAMIQVFTGVYMGGFVLDGKEVDEVRSYEKSELEKMRDKFTPAAEKCLKMLKLLN